jgi:hypothetical protein
LQEFGKRGSKLAIGKGRSESQRQAQCQKLIFIKPDRRKFITIIRIFITFGSGIVSQRGIQPVAYKFYISLGLFFGNLKPLGELSRIRVPIDFCLTMKPVVSFISKFFPMSAPPSMLPAFIHQGPKSKRALPAYGPSSALPIYCCLSFLWRLQN